MTVAVVTGASRGIGRATAVALASRGLDVALLARSVEELEQVAAMVREHGQKALVVRCDVSSESDVDTSARAVRAELGTPAVVVNNAGIVRRAMIGDLSVPDWRRVLDVNLTGAFLVSRAFLPAMLATGAGRFVQVASISATIGTAGASAYCASKWGLVGFTKSLAEELRGTGLAAMSILPGSVDTAMLEGSGFAPQMSPEQVAGTIVYLALDAPAAMNGSSLELFGP